MNGDYGNRDFENPGIARTSNVRGIREIGVDRSIKVLRPSILDPERGHTTVHDDLRLLEKRKDFWPQGETSHSEGPGFNAQGLKRFKETIQLADKKSRGYEFSRYRIRERKLSKGRGIPMMEV
jgi:hypothetical protein